MIDALFMENMDDEETKFYLEWVRESAIIDRYCLALETMRKEQDILAKEAELECYQETGSFDNLDAYYEEKTEENKEKQDGALAKIMKFIIDQFKKLKNFLFGSSKKKELDEDAKKGKEYGLDAEGSKTFSCIKDFVGCLKNPLNFPAFFKKHKIGGLVSIVLAGGIAVGTVKVVQKIKAKKVKELAEETATACDVNEGKLKAISNAISGFLKDHPKAESILNWCKDFTANASKWLMKLTGKEKKEGEDSDSKKKKKKSNDENKDKNESKLSEEEKKKQDKALKDIARNQNRQAWNRAAYTGDSAMDFEDYDAQGFSTFTENDEDDDFFEDLFAEDTDEYSNVISEEVDELTDLLNQI